jgi:hypothetical protein
LGRIGPDSASDIWQRLDEDHAARPVVGTLARCGPVGLLEAAREAGYQPRAGYARKCHLCWEVRRWLALQGWYGQELGPAALYRSSE